MTSLRDLEWLHDERLLSLRFDAATDGGRVATLHLACAQDAANPAWAGRQLTVRFRGVARVLYAGIAVSAAADTVDAIRPGVSEQLRASTSNARRLGIEFPASEATISFHSGSMLELIFDSVTIDVVQAV